jgi:hypothetical protein
MPPHFGWKPVMPLTRVWRNEASAVGDGPSSVRHLENVHTGAKAAARTRNPGPDEPRAHTADVTRAPAAASRRWCRHPPLVSPDSRSGRSWHGSPCSARSCMSGHRGTEVCRWAVWTTCGESSAVDPSRGRPAERPDHFMPLFLSLLVEAARAGGLDSGGRADRQAAASSVTDQGQTPCEPPRRATTRL